MAVLEYKRWRGEPIKLKLYIEDDIVYETTTDTGGDSFIQSLSFNNNEGNMRVNPLGVATSNRVTISIFDKLDRLSPGNMNGPYFKKLVNGLKIELTIQYVENGPWTPYGEYYTTGFSGSYTDGFAGLATIQAEDKLNTIGNLEVPELNVYANVSIKALIKAVFNGLNITDEMYTIDPGIDMSRIYGVLPGTKVRDFLNKVCQITFSRVIIDREGLIRFIPALKLASSYNELTLGPDDISSLKNMNTDNINYNKIRVQYLAYGQNTRAIIYRRSNVVLALGDNSLNDIVFNNQVISIENIDIQYSSENNKAGIDKITYQAFQDGMILNIHVSGAAVNDSDIVIEGIVISGADQYESIDLRNSTKLGGLTFTLETDIQMTKTEAQTLCRNVRDYIEEIARSIDISGCVLTPRLYTGDKVIIKGTGTMYDGTYKVTTQSLNYSENYSMNMTLIRLS